MPTQHVVSISPQNLHKHMALGIFLFVVIVMAFSGTYIVEPGHRGVLVTMGKVREQFAPEGFGLKVPFVTTVIPVSVRQQTKPMVAACYSSDLQQVDMQLNILYRIPENSVVSIYREYYGEPFQSLLVPRIAEAVKEVTALQSAELVVKNRESIKTKSLEAARKKVGGILEIVDIVLEDISLTKELEQAIEAKMVQEQEAAKAKFIQQKTQIEAETAIIKAEGEAKAIRIRGQAVRETPMLIDLQIVEKWDGKTPMVVGSGSGANILLPLGELKGRR